ncbi:hypothetical protein G6L30_08555 [Agrobacterium rhizogenes]|nr:hypothetical protein [Rhizobium rhizogenes]
MATAAAILGCAFPAFGYTLDDHELQIVRIGLGHGALIGQLKAVEHDAENAFVCGYANPKNESGQYVGERIFYGLLRGRRDDAFKFVLFNVGSTPLDTKLTEDLCRERGISF